MKKFTILENFRNSDEQIEDILFEYYTKKDFSILNGFLNSKDVFFVEKAHVSKDTRECKKIQIRIDDIADGIHETGKSKCLTSIDKLQKVLSVVSVFYRRSREKMNYRIEQSYDDMYVVFYAIGPVVSQSHLDKKGNILSLLKELSDILKEMGFRHTFNGTNNWLELKQKAENVQKLLIRLQQNALPNNERYDKITDWFDKIAQNELEMRLSYGGSINKTTQVVVKLKSPDDRTH